MMAPLIETDSCLLRPHFASDARVFWSLRVSGFGVPHPAPDGEAAHAVATWFVESWDGREFGHVTLARRARDDAAFLAFVPSDGAGAGVEVHDALTALSEWGRRFLGCPVIVPELPVSDDKGLPFVLPRRAA